MIAWKDLSGSWLLTTRGTDEVVTIDGLADMVARIVANGSGSATTFWGLRVCVGATAIILACVKYSVGSRPNRWSKDWP